MSLAFEPRITTARKEHKCFACCVKIPKGQVYIGNPGKASDGKFMTTKLCIECAYLLSQKTGANAHNIRQGEFIDRLLPNCLRKKRAEFRKDPRKAIEAAGLLQKVTASSTPKQCQQIVVKASELERRIFHLPESRYKAEQFAKGATLTVKAGVNGKARTAIIKGAWSTDGSGFGCNKRQVAVLVA
jgi:hypothetical protein